MVSYAEPRLPHGMKAALRKMTDYARLMGYGVQASVLLTDGRTGGREFVVFHGGEWMALLEEEEADGDS